MNTQFANIATPNEVVVTTTFSIEIGPMHGDIHVCMPYSMVEPIRDLLTSTLQGETMDVDKRWTKMMTQQIQTAEIELVANMGSADTTLGNVLNMQVGDIIPLKIPETILATVDNVPVMECKYGTRNGQFALRVEKLIAYSTEDTPKGDKHG
jgi:flagellar motor switch protein FliM